MAAEISARLMAATRLVDRLLLGLVAAERPSCRRRPRLTSSQPPPAQQRRDDQAGEEGAHILGEAQDEPDHQGGDRGEEQDRADAQSGERAAAPAAAR